MSSNQPKGSDKSNLTKIRMGLGEAVLRLIRVELMYQQGIYVAEHLVRERDLIVKALNIQKLDLGFDCDGDGRVDIPTDVSIFKVSAETSCCRIVSTDTSRRRRSKGAPKFQRTRPRRRSK